MYIISNFIDVSFLVSPPFILALVFLIGLIIFVIATKRYRKSHKENIKSSYLSTTLRVINTSLAFYSYIIIVFIYFDAPKPLIVVFIILFLNIIMPRYIKERFINDDSDKYSTLENDYTDQ